MKKQKILVMTGGGTGGHIIPNIALIPALKKHFKIYYFGQKNSMEERLITQDGDITFVCIPAVKFARKLTPKNLAIPFALVRAINACKKLLAEIKPDVIFAKGGYVSLPVALAGAKLKIPILAHESDYSMGLANKIILKKAQVMFTTFRETCTSDKTIYSGTPVRPQIFSGQAEVAEKYCNFPRKKTTIMFFGGSKGSKNINKFVFDNLEALDKFNIIHFVGAGNTKAINRPNYCQVEFAENIFDFFAISDVVVCRAGANSIFELLALRKLMLLIPLSKAASRGDQIENAKVFKKESYAEMLEEEDLTLSNFLAKLQHLQKNKFFFVSNMKKVDVGSAAKMICDYILEYANKKNVP